MPAITTFTKVIAQCHHVLDEIFLLHQETVLFGRFDNAILLFNSYKELHDLHKTFEDEKLIPKFNELGNHGRWPASLYKLEHDKIRDLMEKTENDLVRLAEIPPDNRSLGRNIISFLDREKTFKGYCEHHQDREEQGLLPELDNLTDSIWRESIIGPFIAAWESCVNRNMLLINKIGITGPSSDQKPGSRSTQ